MTRQVIRTMDDQAPMRNCISSNLKARGHEVVTAEDGKVLTRRQVLQAVWGAEHGDEANRVWAYVRRLRRKLEPDPEQPRHLFTELGVRGRMPAAD